MKSNKMIISCRVLWANIKHALLAAKDTYDVICLNNVLCIEDAEHVIEVHVEENFKTELSRKQMLTLFNILGNLDEQPIVLDFSKDSYGIVIREATI